MKKSILAEDVVASLDRVKLPNHSARFVVGTVAQALGHDLTDVSLSRNTIQRARAANREITAISGQAAFFPNRPLLLY